MELVAGLAVVIVATFVTTWYNDFVSRAEYISDEPS